MGERERYQQQRQLLLGQSVAAVTCAVVSVTAVVAVGVVAVSIAAVFCPVVVGSR